jgi:predicted ester cyclase
VAVSKEDFSASAVVHAAFERLNDHDPDGLLPLMAEELVEEWPTVGRLEGRNAVRDHLASVFAAIPDFHLNIEEIVTEGEVAFVHWHMTGTFSGAPLEGLVATGRRIDLRGTEYIKLRNGRMVSNFVAFDGLGLAVQIGAMPQPGTLADRVMTAAVNARTALGRRLRHLRSNRQ